MTTTGPPEIAHGSVILLGADLANASDHVAALAEFGLASLLIATPEDLVPSAVASAVVVATLSDDEGDCGLVGEVARLFSSAVIVAVVAHITQRSMRTAIRCGACTLIDLTQPAVEAAETVYQASIGFPRFPGWLVKGNPALAFSAQEVAWLMLLDDTSLSMTEIARQVGWSRAEFFRRLRPIYHRLNAGSRREAVTRAHETGMLS